ncbi:hypothetical protein PQ610_00545 [Tardisphaera miroshnichenkoae]
MRLSSVIAVVIAFLLALAVSYAVSYLSYSSIPVRSNATTTPLSFSISPPSFSRYYDHDILSFLSNSPTVVTMSPSNFTAPSSPSFYNLTFSLYWGYLFRWNLSVSPGLVNGSRLYVSVVPSSSSSSFLPSTNASLFYEGRRLPVNLSGSLSLLFSSTPSSTSAVLEGPSNATLLKLNSPLSPSPEIAVSAEKGGLVLLQVNYVTLSRAESFEAKREGAARSSFLFTFIPSLAAFEAVAIERRRALSLSRVALSLAERFTLPLAVLFLASGGAAGYLYLKGMMPLANDAALVGYFSLLAAVALELAKVYGEEREEKKEKEESGQAARPQRGGPAASQTSLSSWACRAPNPSWWRLLGLGLMAGFTTARRFRFASLGPSLIPLRATKWDEGAFLQALRSAKGGASPSAKRALFRWSYGEYMLARQGAKD